MHGAVVAASLGRSRACRRTTSRVSFKPVVCRTSGDIPSRAPGTTASPARFAPSSPIHLASFRLPSPQPSFGSSLSARSCAFPMEVQSCWFPAAVPARDGAVRPDPWRADGSCRRRTHTPARYGTRNPPHRPPQCSAHRLETRWGEDHLPAANDGAPSHTCSRSNTVRPPGIRRSPDKPFRQRMNAECTMRCVRDAVYTNRARGTARECESRRRMQLTKRTAGTE